MSDLLKELEEAAEFAKSDYLVWYDGGELLLEAKARIEELEAKLAQQGDWVPDARATIAELTGGKESDLKPCPFCGGEAIVDDSAGVSRQCLGVKIFCGNEDCLVKPHIYDLYHTAIDAWNNRTTLAELTGGKDET